MTQGTLSTRRRVEPVADSAPATVSVVIPCFNYARYLPQAVGSALGQAGVDVDVIVVDDASADDSLAVARRLADADARVRVLGHPENRGPVDTFNDGLALARGEFLVRLDADDLLTPGSLRRSVDLARAFPGVGLVYGHPLHFPGGTPPPARTRARLWTIWPGREWLAGRCRDGLNVITSPEVLMRRSVVDVVGGQRDLAHTHDMEMWLRIASASDVGHIEGADQAWHRDHADSLSAREVDQIVDLRERLAAFDMLFGAMPAGADDGLWAVVRRALAQDALEKACHLYDRGRATQESVSELVELARAADPEAPSFPEFRALVRRMEQDLQGRRGRVRGTAAAVRRRVRGERANRHWQRWGVYQDG